MGLPLRIDRAGSCYHVTPAGEQGGLRQVKVRGLKRVDFVFRMLVTAHNLLRMRTLMSLQTP